MRNVWWDVSSGQAGRLRSRRSRAVPASGRRSTVSGSSTGTRQRALRRVSAGTPVGRTLSSARLRWLPLRSRGRRDGDAFQIPASEIRFDLSTVTWKSKQEMFSCTNADVLFPIRAGGKGLFETTISCPLGPRASHRIQER